MIRCSIIVACSLIAATASAVERVRVEVAAGAPRIEVDGKPVRARIFYGIPGIRFVPAPEAGGPISFEFTAIEDEPEHATMHFRFGRAAGEIWLDDIRVIDLTTGDDVLPLTDFSGGQPAFEADWRTWPPAAQNTIGPARVASGGGAQRSAGLRIKIRAPNQEPPTDFHVFHRDNLAIRKGHRYRVSLWARATPARPVSIAFYRPGDRYVDLGGPDGVFEKQVRMAAGAGLSMVSFPIGMPWPKPGEQEDWASVDAACERVLAANSAALLLPRISADAPLWWLDAHPRDEMSWDDGGHRRRMAAVASEDYRRDAAERVAAMVRHIEEKYGSHVAGYHPCGQNTAEWFYEDAWLRGLHGYSAAELMAWRGWLKQRYGDAAHLRTAWRDERIDFEAAEVPTPAARRATPHGSLRNPADERPLIDFVEFQQQMMADAVLAVAHATREASGGKKLVLFFYGYMFELGIMPNGPSASGHYALRRVLDSPDIDLLCSPISYIDRGLGQGAPSMSVPESVALAGKMWLNEDDTATYLSSGDFTGMSFRVGTLAESNEELARNTAQAALRNLATWWMDLGGTGWFNDQRMWNLMKKLEPLDEALLAQPTAFRPEVAAAVDERSVLRVTGGETFQWHGVAGRALHQARPPLGRMGAPYGQYLLDDVTAGRVDAKFYVLLAAWRLDEAERRRLMDATRGRTKLWLYAPGFQQEYGISFSAMRELTGFRLEPANEEVAWATPTDAGRKLGLTTEFGIQGKLDPLFAAMDATPDETLARYSDGSAAVALRRSEEGISLFVGPPVLTSELLRLAARQAGVHLYTESDCNVWANGPFIALHGAEAGPIELDIGKAGAVRDLLTGQAVGVGPKLNVPLDFGQTRILRIEER